LKTYVEPEEVNMMEKVAHYLRDKLLIRFLFHLGCRISEALAIRVEDIDFEHGAVTIEHLKIRSKLLCPNCGAWLGRTHKFCPGCGNRLQESLTQQLEYRRVRRLPIDDDTLNMLRDYISRGGPVQRGGNKLIFGINRHRAWQVES